MILERTVLLHDGAMVYEAKSRFVRFDKVFTSVFSRKSKPLLLSGDLNLPDL